MSKFVRPAGWLRSLFTQSQTSQVNPVEVSDDVSLVQPYDGGGIGLSDPGQSILSVVSTVGVSTTTLIFTTGPTQIARLFCMGVSRNGGATFTAFLQMRHKDVSLFVPCTKRVIVPVDGVFMAEECFNRIVPPDHEVVGRVFSGDAASQANWRVFALIAPLGTVFYT